MLANFIHLQCYSEYSINYGMLRIKPLIEQTARFKMPAVAITDVCNLFAVIKFYKAAIDAKIKPIIGSTLFIDNPEDPSHPWSVIIYCKNIKGYLNISKIISESYFYGQNNINKKPLVTLELLKKYKHNLIIVVNTIYTKYTKNLKLLLNFLEPIFVQHLYLGITRIGNPNELERNNLILDIAESRNLPVVALNAVCFLNRDDFEAHEIRVCIHDGVTLDSPYRTKYYTKLQYFRSPEEMLKLFDDLPSALSNAINIAKRCNLILSLDSVYLPNFSVPLNESPDKYLFKKAHSGLNEKVDKLDKCYMQRLNLELKVINDMGFTCYFLIVADFIDWAHKNNIPVGPGRGSGAGSLVAFALNITKIDPLQYNLLFERFLNSERISMPDLDIDFCIEGRDKVIEYVTNKYGSDSVAQIITYGTMTAKSVIRDVGRALGHPYGFVDKIAKQIPNELGITLSKALIKEKHLKDQYDNDEDIKALIDVAKKLEGITRNIGKHAGGVVISPKPLVNFTPLYCDLEENQVITQFDKNDLESIGLVKFDFLGLRTLTIINWTLKIIESRKNVKIDINKIKLNDFDTFNLLRNVNTTAIFQLESRGMKDLIRRMQPDCFEDIIALIALFRPGPLQSGMVDDFINRKRGKSKIESYFHSDIKSILESTYGVILYQEQVMQIAQVLAGYTLGSADLLRRAMSKKNIAEMAKQRDIFIKKSIKRGVDEKTANYIFNLMEKFAGYGFNKSHSTAYALLSYQTAWLKTHYPAEFLTAVLSADMTQIDKIVIFIDDCHKNAIKILPPDINRSLYKFSVDDTGKIIYGLGAIKGLGKAAIVNIIEIRKKHGPFKNLFDLCRRIDPQKVTRRILESLIHCGGLDSFGIHRGALIGNLKNALRAADQFQNDKKLGQIDIFSDKSDDIDQQMKIFHYPKWTNDFCLAKEKATLGFYLSDHPIKRFERELSNIITHKIADLYLSKNRHIHTIAGILDTIHTTFTKRGDKIAFIKLEDLSGKQEIVIFSDLLNDCRDILKKDNLLIIKGKIKSDEYSDTIRMVALQIMDILTVRNNLAKCLLLRVDAKQGLVKDFIPNLQMIFQSMPGKCPVQMLYINNEINVRLKFKNTWYVKPDSKLLIAIENLNYINLQVEFCY